MRLIELRLKNLNSLKGEWHIDFSDPAFINEGIFAITGQTGAGKTTILDAICLALYGETPRINSISKTSNEVMTRQTGECSAEVVIELDGEQYRCSWGQRRAYGKPDGKLQDATHEIAKINKSADKHLNNGADDILESKLSRTRDKIIELTRMDFQQFTRSILLAQGSFSAFLKAKADERADILEKITGTDIYATISERVFETKRDEEAKLNQLQAGLDGIALLSVEAEQELKASEQSLRKEADTHNADLQTLNEQIKWLDSVAELKLNVTQYEADLDRAKQAQSDFQIDHTRLDQANKALEIDSDFSKLEHSRQSVRHLVQEQQSNAEQLPSAKAQLETILATLKQSQHNAVQAAATLEESLPHIAKTRQLDIEIKQLNTTLSDHKQRYSQQTNTLTGLKTAIEADLQARRVTEQALKDTNDYLGNHPHFVSLETDIANMDSTCARIKSLLYGNADLASSNLTDQSQLAKYQTQLDDLTHQITANQSQIEAKQQLLAQAQQQHSALLNTQSASSIREQQDRIDDQATQLQGIQQKLQQLDERTNQLATLTQTLPHIQSDISAAKNRLALFEEELTALNKQRKDKQEHLALLQQVAKLEDYIDQLESGKPCPLCGATEHPYAQHHPLREVTPPSTSAMDAQQPPSKLAQVDQEIKQLDQRIDLVKADQSKAEIEQATHNNNLVRLQQDSRALREHIKALVAETSHQVTQITTSAKPLEGLEQSDTLAMEPLNNELVKLDQLLTAWQGAAMDVDGTSAEDNKAQELIAMVQSALTVSTELKQTLSDHKLVLKQLLTDLDTSTANLVAIEKDIAQLERSAQDLTNQLNAANTEHKLASQRLQSSQKNINNNFNDLGGLLVTLSQLINRYQPDVAAQKSEPCSVTAYQTLTQSIESRQILTSDDIEGCFNAFRQYRSTLKALKLHYNEQLSAKQTLDTTLSNLAIQLKSNQSQLDEGQQALNLLNKQIEDQSAQLDLLITQRKALFADKNPDDEEKHLRALVDGAKTHLNDTQRQHDAAEQLVKQLIDQQQTIQQQLSTAQQTLEEQEITFNQKLLEHNFVDEASFKQARLPRSERDALTEQQQKIINDLQRSQSLLSQSQSLLTQKLATPLTTEIREDLISRQQHLQSLMNALSEQIGGIKQQLANNEKRKSDNQAQQAAIEAQKENLQVWLQLYKLIGSADGKKYRTFAQGLTFQIMVSHANAKLQKMSDRYLLIRDEDSPLELNVIDNYQGGEIRSTKNLSGGEGFIISLALALGLSQMASQNIRVDSLFLDEGFGTLDEDSLDIALDTLTSLQQEGKLIGVISHVQALKERILTQIKVEKLSGGHSQLVGAGCSKIAG